MLLPYGLHLQPLQGTFSHEFLTQLQIFIEALPGAAMAEMDTQREKAWWLYGSTFTQEEACHYPQLAHTSIVIIKEDEVALRFSSTTFEEHEASIIRWVLEHCACTIYDSDWAIELKTPDDLAAWMSTYNVRNTNIQQRAMSVLTEELVYAFCHAIHYSSHHEYILLLSTRSHGERRLVIPEETIVLHENSYLPHLSKTQLVALQLFALCGSSISSVLFTPERVLHIAFDQTAQLDICSTAPGDYEFAWALESPAPYHPLDWNERVWVRRGGDIVVADQTRASVHDC